MRSREDMASAFVNERFACLEGPMHNDRIELETSIDVDFPLTHEHRLSQGDVNHRELHAPFRKLHALVGRCSRPRLASPAWARTSRARQRAGPGYAKGA